MLLIIIIFVYFTPKQRFLGKLIPMLKSEEIHNHLGYNIANKS